jgi:hypothetical protein
MTSRRDDHDRIAVVTGAESGIGRAVSVALADAGYDIGITSHLDAAHAEQTADEVRKAGRRAEIRPLDLSRLPQAADVVDDFAEALGGIGVLINCAGTGIDSPAVDVSYEDWRLQLAVDLDGPFLCAQRAARRMIAAGRGGRIINITSVHEHAPRVGSAAYCSAKGGLGMLTKVLAQEWGQHGITVNAVAPGEIATPMTGQEDQDPFQVHRPGIPLGRPGDAREIAAVVTLLAGAGGSYVTGASWVVDGGMLLMGPQAGSHMTGEDWRKG